MDTLTALFGNPVKVKLLRLFLFNENVPFVLKEVIERSKGAGGAVQKELNVLVKADLVKKKQISKEVQVVRGKKTVTKKIEGTGYILNPKFPFLDPLKNLLTVATIQADDGLMKRFTGVGRLKLLLAAGVFIQNWDSRVDLLIVGDELNQNRIESIVKVIESEIGKEISYSAFETQDFEYRIGIHDRLVRDILDYPHVTLLDRMSIEPQQ